MNNADQQSIIWADNLRSLMHDRVSSADHPDFAGALARNNVLTAILFHWKGHGAPDARQEGRHADDTAPPLIHGTGDTFPNWEETCSNTSGRKSLARRGPRPSMCAVQLLRRSRVSGLRKRASSKMREFSDSVPRIRKSFAAFEQVQRTVRPFRDAQVFCLHSRLKRKFRNSSDHATTTSQLGGKIETMLWAIIPLLSVAISLRSASAESAATTNTTGNALRTEPTRRPFPQWATSTTTTR